jgi:aspartyl protease family protein
MNIAIKAAAFCGISALVVGVISGSSGTGTPVADLQGPSDETRFTSAVVSARTSYERAPNELAAGGIRSGRQQAICNIVLNQSASDWVGKITKLTSNGDGKGVISIALAPNVQVSTWNNSLSDMRDDTLIDPTSSLFKALATMKVGDPVQFSGRFSSSGTDCVGEQSVTLQGSMTDPAFTMRFSSITRKAAPVETVAQTGPRSLSIQRDARGHFPTEGRIEGQRIGFMIDTGASVIALNETSAARFGLRPPRGDYNATVTTANGTIKAARTRLAMVDVGGLVVRDVDAMVLPDEVLSENLLGLSFLSKLKRFEYANGKMELEQ